MSLWKRPNIFLYSYLLGCFSHRICYCSFWGHEFIKNWNMFDNRWNIGLTNNSIFVHLFNFCLYSQFIIIFLNKIISLPNYTYYLQRSVLIKSTLTQNNLIVDVNVLYPNTYSSLIRQFQMNLKPEPDRT